MTDNTPTRRIPTFFYGLYMDPEVLAMKQVAPQAPRRAIAEGYALRLGNKATLLRAPGGRAQGMVYELTHAEIEALYKGLEEYKPEPLLVTEESGTRAAVLTMVLHAPPAPEERNPDYAARLRASLAKLGFPQDYVATVA